MPPIPRPRITYANVVATLALFIALGGVSYAATQLPKNSVGNRQIKDGAVSTSKMSSAAVKTIKSWAGKDGLPGIQGPKGPAGLTGDIGPRGATGIAGSAGPKGDTGPRGTTAVKAYVETFNHPDYNEAVTASVRCPEGQMATGGGFIGGAALEVIQSAPTGANNLPVSADPQGGSPRVAFDAVGWTVTLQNTFSGPHPFAYRQIYVLCAAP